MKLKFYSFGAAAALLAVSSAFITYEKAFADSVGIGEVSTPSNHAAMWNNNGSPDEAGKTPLDFGWEAWNGDVRVLSDVGEANASMVTRFRTTDKYVGETFPHLLLHFQNTKVDHFAFPLADITPGKTYEVRILFHRHENDNRYAGFGVNSRPNRTGVNYGEVTHPTPAGAWETARFFFTATENDDNEYYLTFFQPKGTLRLLAIGDIRVVEAEPFSLENASEQNPADLTWKYISNPSFEASHSDDNGTYILDWNNSGMQKQENDDFPRHGRIYVEKWTSSASNVSNVSISQTLRNLPGGKYRLSAIAQNVKQNSDIAVSGAYIFAGEAYAEVSAPGDYSVTFDVPAIGSGEVNIGFKTVNAVGNYVGVDNMRLEYLGAASDNTLTLNVVVADFKNNPVAGAGVSLDVTDRTAVTDAEGKASLSFSYSGTENPVLTVSKEGFAAYSAALHWGGSYTHSQNIQLREAQPVVGNLLANALHGTIGGYPAGWLDYTRAGATRDHRGMATLRNNIGKEEGTNPEMLMLRWDDAWSGISDADACRP